MGLYLGLDIGVSSVGYGIVNDDGEAVDAGVRLFSEGTSKDNADRRERRHARRTLRRKQHRLERADRLFVASELASFDEKKNIDLQCDTGVTPYHLRVRGLREPLADKELVIALRHLLKHRGSAPLNACETGVEDLDGKKAQSTRALISKTKAALDGDRFVCEIQLERLNNPDVAHVRGIENRFLSEHYAKEARQLLETQRRYNPLVSEVFCDAYMKLLETRRAYYEGPGEGSPFAWRDESGDADLELWMERLMGKCVYTGETRCVKLAPSAELFNLLNDLNNMLIDGEHLSYAEKVQLVDGLFSKQKASPDSKKVLTFLGRDKNAVVTGLRANKSGKQIFTELKGWHYIQKANIASGSTFNMNDLETADEIARILTVYQDEENAAAQLKGLNLDPAFITELTAVYRGEKASEFKGTHSLSRTAIMYVLDDLWMTSKNQMELFSEKGMKPQHTSLYVKNGRIMPEIVQNMAVSAVARRAISQTFTVFNDLLDKYPQGFVHVTVEMARESNSEDQKKFINALQNRHEQMNKDVDALLEGRHANGKLREKLRLYLLQDCKDIYTGEKLDIEEIVCNPTYCEIDHIIPLSISFDNSFNNKVLTLTSNNQSKGQRTPYQWMQEPGAPDYGQFATRVLEIKDSQKMPKKKRENLLCKLDVNKWEVRSKFINRNLVDTRYACREVVYALTECLKDTSSVVGTVNGSFTHYLRTLWGLSKDRNADYSHHAVDALVVAASPLVTNQLSIIQNYDLFEDAADGSAYVVDKRTGEVVDDSENLEMAVRQFKRFAKSYRSFGGFKYSHKVDKKKNRGLGNDTLYSVRVRPSDGREWKLGKIADLYDPKLPFKKLKELFEDAPENLLVFEGNHPTFLKLKEVYDAYKRDGKCNPFALYHEEHGYITKHSASGTGPVVKSLKYYDAPVAENAFDISVKQGCKEGHRVIMEGQTTYRVDVYKAKKGYKIVRVSAAMAAGTNQGLAQWEREKVKQRITEDDKFEFSLYPNDLFMLDDILYRFCGYKTGNRISCQYVDRLNQNKNHKAESLTPSVGPSTSSIIKVDAKSLGIVV